MAVGVGLLVLGKVQLEMMYAIALAEGLKARREKGCDTMYGHVDGAAGIH